MSSPNHPPQTPSGGPPGPNLGPEPGLPWQAHHAAEPMPESIQAQDEAGQWHTVPWEGTMQEGGTLRNRAARLLHLGAHIIRTARRLDPDAEPPHLRGTFVDPATLAPPPPADRGVGPIRPPRPYTGYQLPPQPRPPDAPPLPHVPRTQRPVHGTGFARVPAEATLPESEESPEREPTPLERAVQRWFEAEDEMGRLTDPLRTPYSAELTPFADHDKLPHIGKYLSNQLRGSKPTDKGSRDLLPEPEAVEDGPYIHPMRLQTWMGNMVDMDPRSPTVGQTLLTPQHLGISEAAAARLNRQNADALPTVTEATDATGRPVRATLPPSDPADQEMAHGGIHEMIQEATQANIAAMQTAPPDWQNQMIMLRASDKRAWNEMQLFYREADPATQLRFVQIDMSRVDETGAPNPNFGQPLLDHRTGEPKLGPGALEFMYAVRRDRRAGAWARQRTEDLPDGVITDSHGHIDTAARDGYRAAFKEAYYSLLAIRAANPDNGPVIDGFLDDLKLLDEARDERADAGAQIEHIQAEQRAAEQARLAPPPPARRRRVLGFRRRAPAVVRRT